MLDAASVKSHHAGVRDGSRPSLPVASDGCQDCVLAATPQTGEVSRKSFAHVAATQAVSDSIRPEVQSLIDFIGKAHDMSLVSTTRDMPPMPPPKGFLAQRFGIDINGGHTHRFLVMDTESLVGHMATVVPGQTKVNGSIGEVPDRSGLFDRQKSTDFNAHELEAITTAFIQKAGAGHGFQQGSDIAVAIYANGDGAKYASIFAKAGHPLPR